MTNSNSFPRSVLLLIVFALYTTAVAQQAAEPPVAKPGPTPIPAKPLVDQSVPAGWRRYELLADPAFSVIFPATPDAAVERGEGGSVTYIYTATGANGVYVGAHFSGLGDTNDPQRQETFFNSFVKGFVQGVQETLAKSNFNFQLQLTTAKKITIPSGQKGFQQDMTLGPFTGQAQIVFIGQTGFAIVSLWTEKSPQAESEAFFNSFRVTPK